MSYNHVNVTLTLVQIKKLQSKNAVTCGTSITLKHDQLTGGPNKLSLTQTQLNHRNKAKATHKGIKIDFSAAAIKDMTKTGGIFPFLAAIPGLIATSAPAVAKAAALGAVGTAAGMAAKKALGGRYTRKRGGAFPMAFTATRQMNPYFLRMSRVAVPALIVALGGTPGLFKKKVTA